AKRGRTRPIGVARGRGRVRPGRGLRVTAMEVSASAASPSDRPRLTQTEGVLDAITCEMRRDERVLYIGQDIGAMGGSLQGTQGLLAAFGPRRIREAPISESAMVGAAIGAALFGRRPIVEISFGEFLPAAMSQIVNQAA